MIGSMYQLGLGGLQVDENEACKWYLLASEKGNGVASNNLGTMALMRGDSEEAERYYQTARNQGFLHTPLIQRNRVKFKLDTIRRSDSIAYTMRDFRDKGRKPRFNRNAPIPRAAIRPRYSRRPGPRRHRFVSINAPTRTRASRAARAATIAK